MSMEVIEDDVHHNGHRASSNHHSDSATTSTPPTAVDAARARPLLCIRFYRSMIMLMTVTFIVLSVLRSMRLDHIIPWPQYPSFVFVILDMILLVGLGASITQNLTSLIVFGWLVATTFLLIFFGNTVSNQFQSDPYGKPSSLSCLARVSFGRKFRVNTLNPWDLCVLDDSVGNVEIGHQFVL